MKRITSALRAFFTSSGSLSHNSIRSLFFQLGGLGATVLLGIALARTLGPAGKGLVGYAAVGLSLATVTFNGLSEAVSYQFGRRKFAMRDVHRSMLTVMAVVTPIVILLLLGIAYAVPSQRVLVAAAVVFPFALYTQMAVPFFMIRGRVLLLNYQQVLTSIGYAAIASLAAIFLHASYVAVLAVWIATTVLGAAYLFWRMLLMIRDASAEEVQREEPPPELPAGEMVKDQLRFAWKAGFASIASYLNLRIDVILVSIMLSYREFGIYSQAIAMGELMWKIAQSMTWSSMGRIASDSPAAAAELVAKITRNIFALQLAAGVFAFIAGPFLMHLVYGPKFDGVGTALRILLPGLVLYTIESSISYYLVIHEGKALLRVAVQSTSIVTCALVTLLTIKRFGIYGAAFATTLTYLGVISFMSVYFSRLTGVSLRDMFILKRSDIDRYRGMLEKILGKTGADRLGAKGEA